MQFTVPQFIEHEPKLFFGMTFKQLSVIAVAGAIIITLWFTIGSKNFLLFLALSVILSLSAFSLGFLKINGRPLPLMMTKIFNFSFGTKIYLWKKKNIPPKMVQRVTRKTTEEDKSSPLKFAEKSRLKNLSTQIETRI
jgi:hypothetical protein